MAGLEFYWEDTTIKMHFAPSPHVVNSNASPAAVSVPSAHVGALTAVQEAAVITPGCVLRSHIFISAGH